MARDFPNSLGLYTGTPLSLRMSMTFLALLRYVLVDLYKHHGGSRVAISPYYCQRVKNHEHVQKKQYQPCDLYVNCHVT
ncbi:uncharacterized protein YALI1_C02421g [Yarrowia lipolytica]|uniref:Uncharacterized protein n=1 Tax=Yarrowia lipolytica TaxID=4952 RepID=A0A1D8N997_YARLL|nr:hypothetical protein YALI1_C02421g [Yarrowia lipolytica]